MTLYQVPNQLPLGEQRNRMNDRDFLQQAVPALAERFEHEQGVMQLIQDHARPKHGGEQMASIAFNVPSEKFQKRDQWGAERAQPAQPPQSARRSEMQQALFDDSAAYTLVDGRGGGGAYVKGALPIGAAQPPPPQASRQAYLQQQYQQQQYLQQHHPQQGGPATAPPPQRPLVPSSAMLGADPSARWVVDRDQQLTLGTDPRYLAQAAEMGAANAKLCVANRLHSCRSHLSFGGHELNPGGHRLNDQLPPHDDYGVARLRSDPILAPQRCSEQVPIATLPLPAAAPTAAAPTAAPSSPPTTAHIRSACHPHRRLPVSPWLRCCAQVKPLLSDPDPNMPPPSAGPIKPFAGRSQQSSISLSNDAMNEPMPRKPFAGRRALSSVFEDRAGAAGPGGPCTTHRSRAPHPRTAPAHRTRAPQPCVAPAHRTTPTPHTDTAHRTLPLHTTLLRPHPHAPLPSPLPLPHRHPPLPRCTAVAPCGSYVGIDYSGGPVIKKNDHVRR